jgi:hypothetical protein
VSPRASSAFAGVSILWGMPYLLIKVTVDHGLPPVSVIWVRVVLGAAVLLGISWRAGLLATLRGRFRWSATLAHWSRSPWGLWSSASIPGSEPPAAFRSSSSAHGSQCGGKPIRVEFGGGSYVTRPRRSEPRFSDHSQAAAVSAIALARISHCSVREVIMTHVSTTTALVGTE